MVIQKSVVSQSKIYSTVIHDIKFGGTFYRTKVWSSPFPYLVSFRKGEQPHECSICKRRFRDPSSKKRHLRLHDAGRPIRQFIKPTLVLNPETGDMKEVILDPRDGTPIKTEKGEDRQPETFVTASGKKGLFPCSICNKARSIIYLFNFPGNIFRGKHES